MGDPCGLRSAYPCKRYNKRIGHLFLIFSLFARAEQSSVWGYLIAAQLCIFLVVLSLILYSFSSKYISYVCANSYCRFNIAMDIQNMKFILKNQFSMLLFEVKDVGSPKTAAQIQTRKHGLQRWPISPHLQTFPEKVFYTEAWKFRSGSIGGGPIF